MLNKEKRQNKCLERKTENKRQTKIETKRERGKRYKRHLKINSKLSKAATDAQTYSCAHTNFQEWSHIHFVTLQDIATKDI